MLGVRIPPGARFQARLVSLTRTRPALKKPRTSKTKIVGLLSLLALIVVIGASLALLLHPQKWLLMRRFVKVFTGPAVKVVTVPEGWNRFQVAARLQAAGVTRAEDFLVLTEEPTFLKELGIPGSTAEGYLFPDTYQFYAGGSPLTVLKAMTENFGKKFAALRKTYPKGLEPYGAISSEPEHAAVILASIVQEEVAARDEAPIVAGIFLKRLTDPGFVPHLLQADPTVAYGCLAQDPPPPSCEAFDGVLEKKHLRDVDNIYNTYIYTGLPPGPITNPGTEALTAALDPKTTPYYYFVSKGDGTHAFSATLEEHNAAVEKYR
jgi:UPF0755 protein